jgi:hypothetical protein
VQVGDTDTLKLILKANNWDIASITSRQNPITPYIEDVTIIANMWSSLDAGQLESWIREDLGSRYSIGAVSVTVLSRTGKVPVSITKPAVRTAANAPAVVSSSSPEITALKDQLAALTNKITTPTKKNLDSYAADLGVSKTALTFLVGAVGVVVLLSLTKK